MSNNKIVASIPNTITCMSLVCGCVAIVMAFRSMEQVVNLVVHVEQIEVVLDNLRNFCCRIVEKCAVRSLTELTRACVALLSFEETN